MKYKFIPAGSSVDEFSSSELYLDVGNGLKKGVIDHHQLSNEQKSATRLVYENPAFITLNTVSIILHKSPDLDCIAASYLVEHYIKKGEFPAFASDLCDFLDRSDFGFASQNVVSLSSLFSIIKSSSANEIDIVNNGHELIEKLSLYGFDDVESSTAFNVESKTIYADVEIFEQDMKSAEIREFNLVLKKKSKTVLSKALILDKPQSKLFKVWARENGYDLLIVRWSEQRVVISLKADSFLSLEGIGNRLNLAEKIKRSRLKISIDEENRVGYDMPDPWYDGRAHSYTIVDSPRRGTLLSFEEIMSMLDTQTYQSDQISERA